jgi:type II secretory pathway component PulK
MNQRRGVVMIVVIVCVVVATVICGLLLKMAVLGRETADAQHRSEQARWLAEAGIERAAARLAADARYSGETWTLPPAELPRGGQVRIAVETPPGTPARRLVRVVAQYPDDPRYGCRCQKEIMVDVK